MVELTGLNKEYYDTLLATFNNREKEDGKIAAMEDLEEGGGVERIDREMFAKEGFTAFYMKNGKRHVIAPRGYKFSGPLIPEGVDIKPIFV